MKKLEDVLLNPVRMRIVQHLFYLKSTTVSKLIELMNDIPRTTLYRHINILYEWGLLTVIKEIKVRGTYEREYALDIEKVYEASSNNPVEKGIYAFHMKLLADFESYFKAPGADPVKDRLFLSENILMLSDTEFDQCVDEIFGVMKKYMNLIMEKERKSRLVSIISSPYITT